MDEQELEKIFGSYVTWRLTDNTWVISFMNGSQYLYLLEGEDAALLIDTGYAAGRLRPFVEKITKKPVKVINTHFHPDHGAGNGEWEQAYMSAGEVIDAPSMAATAGDMSKLPYPDYEKIHVKTGDVIDLGGRKIEIFDALPCHSNSDLYLLDRGNRMFFMGDEMDPQQVLLYDNTKNPEMEARYDEHVALQNFKKNLQLAQSLEGEFDYLLANHNGTPLAKSYIEEYMGLVDAVYSGEAVICEGLEHPYIEMDPVAPKLCRVRYKSVSIFAFRDQIEKLYGSGK